MNQIIIKLKLQKINPGENSFPQKMETIYATQNIDLGIKLA